MANSGSPLSPSLDSINSCHLLSNVIMSFQAFGKDIDVMSEDYVIEWDKDFADDLNVVASVFTAHPNLMAHYFLSTFDAT